MLFLTGDGIMIRLNDTQAILLACACQRADGSILPLHTSVKPGGAAKALATLHRHGLVEEREVDGARPVHRTEGDTRFGLFVTATGKIAIGMDDEGEQAMDNAAPPSPTVADAGKASTKIATVLALLGQPDGALARDLIAATGWLPHTMRAAITGLRKKGHAIERTRREGVTGYRIVSAG